MKIKVPEITLATLNKLDRLEAAPAHFLDLLDSAEHQRAAQLPAEQSVRFVTIRGFVREVLGTYCGRTPESVLFDWPARGKPAIADPSGVKFNISHTKGLMVVAISRDGPVGVDIERRGRRNDFLAVAQRYFPIEENNFIGDGDNAEDRFLQLWTLKESLAKLSGRGIHPQLLESATKITKDGPIPSPTDYPLVAQSYLRSGDYWLSLCASGQRREKLKVLDLHQVWERWP